MKQNLKNGGQKLNLPEARNLSEIGSVEKASLSTGCLKKDTNVVGSNGND